MQMRKMLLVIVVVVLVGCGGSPAPEMFETINSGLNPGGADSVVAPAAPPVSVEAPASASGGSSSDNSGSSAQPQIERLVIKNASMSLQVAQVTEADAAIRAKVEAWGGFIVNSQSRGSDDSLTIDLHFRVPAEHFDQALTELEQLAEKVLSREVSGEDVTAEFVDLQSQLRNLEATRDRLMTFLDRSETVEEALMVNQSLSDIQGQIERAKGRMQYLQQSAALSSLSVSLRSRPAPSPIVEPEGWRPLEVARGALRDLIELGQLLVNLLIIVLVWTPVWLTIVLVVLWVRRRRRRGKAKEEQQSS